MITGQGANTISRLGSAATDRDASYHWSHGPLERDDVFNVKTFPGRFVKRRHRVIQRPAETTTQDDPQFIIVYKQLPLP